MDDLVLVDVLEPQAKLDEPVGYDILADPLLLLLVCSDEVRKLTLLAVLHDDDELFVLKKGVVVLDHERTIQLS